MANELNAPPRAEIAALQALFARIEREALVLKTGGALERGIYAARVAGSAVELLGALVALVAELDADLTGAYEALAAIEHSYPPVPPPLRADA